MTTLLMPLALVIVIALSLALGIATGYLLIIGILNAFSRSRDNAIRSSARGLVPHAGSTGD